MKTVTVRFEDAELELVKKASKIENRTPSNFVKHAAVMIAEAQEKQVQ